jgi:hypothetical protein
MTPFAKCPGLKGRSATAWLVDAVRVEDLDSAQKMNPRSF